MNPDDDLLQPIPPIVSLKDAALMFERDLPSLCDAQLAQVLVEARNLGAHPIAEMLAPLARTELQRRRAMNAALPDSLPDDFRTDRD